MDLEMPVTKMSTGTKGMTRASKLFIKIDKEGLLTDTVSISDVVNFDCYESIVSSAQRIIASFVSTTPDQILVNSIFYYKRRARSNRMNPVQIWCTTDVFRAIAEHPSGEVPLGVYWSQKFRAPSKGKQSVKRRSQVEIDWAALSELRKSASPKPEVAGKEVSVPEKRRKTDNSSYKTYMPDGGVEGEGEVKPAVDNGAVYKGFPPSPPAAVPTVQTVPVLHKVTADPKKNPAKLSVPDGEGEEGGGKDASSRYAVKPQYQWPDGAKCEVLLNYDGITERKTLDSNLSYVVQSLLKGNYSVLSRELAASFSSNYNKWGGVKPSVENLELMTKFSKPQTRDPPRKVPIKYLQDAKFEIFNILSLLRLSKARFKQLLKWMKSLKLEEGKQGKFYLSERDTIGTGLRVVYDTDEQAAMKLNHIYKSRMTATTARTLHSIESLSNVPQPTANNNVKMLDKYMFLVPQSQWIKATGAPFTVQSVESVEKQDVAAAHPSTVDMLTSTDKNSNSASTSKASAESGKSPSPERSSVQPESDASEKPVPVKSLPTIMRRKQRTPTQKPRTSSPPVPIQLYRNFPVGDPSTENSEIPLEYIKQEPEDYSETTESTTEDFDEASPADVYTDSADNLGDMLKSDAKMLQTSDKSPFDLVIKSEPPDDF